ncbi:MAG: hypothetical protein RLW42_12925, partial [Gammaproteobacteria bacterium]
MLDWDDPIAPFKADSTTRETRAMLATEALAAVERAERSAPPAADVATVPPRAATLHDGATPVSAPAP